MLTFLAANLTPINVIRTFKRVARYEDANWRKFADQCLEMNEAYMKLVLESEGFLELNHAELCAMIKCDSLGADELVIYNAVSHHSRDVSRISE